jgi:hypothetical protein
MEQLDRLLIAVGIARWNVLFAEELDEGTWQDRRALLNERHEELNTALDAYLDATAQPICRKFPTDQCVCDDNGWAHCEYGESTRRRDDR